ncbi:MAG: adenylate/guanylate cyclase domain-containing protein [Bacteroidales bacterium]
MLFACFICRSQDAEVDSLKIIIQSASDDSTKVNMLIDLAGKYYLTDSAAAIKYSTQARDLALKIEFKTGLAYAYKSIGLSYYFKSVPLEAVLNWEKSLATFEEINDLKGQSNMLNNLGAVYFNQGDDAKALDYYLRSLRVAEAIKDSLRITTALVNIGAVYSGKESSHDLATKYYLRSIELSEILGNHDAIGASSVNLAEIFLSDKNDTEALLYFEKALAAYKQSTTGNVPYALNGIGKVYAQRNEYDTAINYFNQAYEIANSNNAEIETAQALIELGKIYNTTGKYALAIKNLRQADTIASRLDMLKELKDIYEALALVYSNINDFNNAFVYQELLTQIKDSIYNSEMDKKMQRQALMYDIEKQQGEMVLQESIIRQQKILRNASAIVGILMILLAGGLFNRYKYVRKTKQIIEHEKDRSDKLLLNILPEETAEELKEKGSATPKHYDMVSVLFTDFKGFTKIAEKLTPQELVAELNHCFLEFDFIIDKYNLEKIKTIGDAYMCAGGIPVANTSNPVDIVKAGLEIKEYMDHLKKVRESKGQDYWELRIGIHTGSVIAGVVGKNKFAYDIWGDAVNTASRMESSGIPGVVNISGATYELVKDHFDCTHRGKIQAKNKGEIDMYIVEGPKTEKASQNHEYSEVSGEGKI